MTVAAAASEDQPPIRIGERIRLLLGRVNQSPAWLADKMGVDRSTVTRALNGDRNPTAKTLGDMATVLGVTLAEMVAGTDAEDRVQEAQNLVPRSAYAEAVQKVIEYEARVNDLMTRTRDLTEAASRDREEARHARSDRAEMERKVIFVANERDQARREAAQHEHDARRYRDALARAVADVAMLQAKVQELGAAVEAGNQTGKVAAILAGVAAVVSVANYLGNDADDAGGPDDAPGEPN